MKLTSLFIAMALSQTSFADSLLPDHQSQSPWFTDAHQAMMKNQQTIAGAKAKNVILFVGDGMGISTLTAARILNGQNQGLSGEEGQLFFETFDHTALVKTYSVDAQTPDSAGTMTAMMTGVKTDSGILSIDEDVVRGNCDSIKGNELTSALELAEIKGLATGLISTARITHATPAAAYSKSVDRNYEDDSDILGAQISYVANEKYEGDKNLVTEQDLADSNAMFESCVDIASQLVNFERDVEERFSGVDIDGIDVVMGGGRRHFLPKDAAFNSSDARSAVEGDRLDSLDLTQQWQQMYPMGKYVIDQTGFDQLGMDDHKVLALFNESHMQYEADRENDLAGEPSLSEMTHKAIDILNNHQKGFFLTVESGRIDHAHHAGNAYNALNDTIELAKAVQLAYENTNPEETLILVTADHGHVFTIAGYPKRGNPILGKVVGVGQTEPTLSSDNLPYTTLGYANGLGFIDLGNQTNADAGYYVSKSELQPGRVDITGVDTQTPGYHQEALVPTSSETHSGEDISLHASGPGSHLVTGVIEQNKIFHIINQSLGLIE